jgi:hypothetical protein
MRQDPALKILAEILFDVTGNRETRLIRKPAAGQTRFPDGLAPPDTLRCAWAVGADRPL